jgi:hypothetical protein
MYYSYTNNKLDLELKDYLDKKVINIDCEAKLFNKAYRDPYYLFKFGNTFFEYKEYRKAFNIYSFLIHSNLDYSYKKEVYSNMGYMYENGFGVEKSFTNALIMYKNAKNYQAITRLRIFDKNLKKYANDTINSLKDEENTIFNINSYIGKSHTDKKRDIEYEKKIIEHIIKTNNITAANILARFLYFTNDLIHKNVLIELLALWGNPNSSYETYIYYKYTDIRKARYFLKLYFQQMSQKIKFCSDNDIRNGCFMPGSTFAVTGC